MANEDSPVDIGSRLELLLDEYLIDRMANGVRLQMHRPVRREVVLRTDAPWEGNACAFQSVFRDGDLYRMYYRGLHYRNWGPAAPRCVNTCSGILTSVQPSSSSIREQPAVNSPVDSTTPCGVKKR